jgi:hypothetical protein
MEIRAASFVGGEGCGDRDFRRLSADCEGRSAPVLDLSPEAGSFLSGSRRLYRARHDGLEIVVRAFDASQFEAGEVEREIETLSNLRDPLIAPPIRFGLAEGKLKIGQLHATGGSLAEVVWPGPAWWTPTARSSELRWCFGWGRVSDCSTAI